MGVPVTWSILSECEYNLATNGTRLDLLKSIGGLGQRQDSVQLRLYGARCSEFAQLLVILVGLIRFFLAEISPKYANHTIALDQRQAQWQLRYVAAGKANHQPAASPGD